MAWIVLGGASLVAAAGVLSKAFSFLAALILTRHLGPGPYGQVALLTSVATIGSALALGGIDHAYARFFFSSSGKAQGRQVERFCWRYGMLAGLIVSAIGGVIWLLIRGSVPVVRSLAPAVVAACLLSVLQALAITRQRLKGHYGHVAAASMVGGLCGAALSVGLALLGFHGAWVLVGGLLFGLVFPCLVLGWLPIREVLGKIDLDSSTRWMILRMGWSAAVLAPAYWVTSATDRWFIGGSWGAEAVGVFSFAVNIGTLGLMLSSGISTAWFPEAARTFEENPGEAPRVLGRLWTYLTWLLLVGWAATSALGGDLLRAVADPRFHPGASYIPWLAGGTCFYGIASLAGTGPLLAKNLRPVMLWWLAGAALSLGMNALLIPRFGPRAAAWTYCLAHAMVAAGILWRAQVKLPLRIAWIRLALGGTLLVLIGGWMAAPWTGQPWKSLGLKVSALAIISILGYALQLGRLINFDWTNIVGKIFQSLNRN